MCCFRGELIAARLAGKSIFNAIADCKSAR
jgi:hypothetical protein